ncbi:LIM domain and actin-binding protein 1-like [Ostrea edulis]|uniref:LIM domain and actin-binding protein 1-like n=1 Tax=Ostrea edulis TaxID=37623 RepID=UPI0024AF4668|nr:LIM domain and actin-binding protein 1-like [Ostrea edulis]
MEEDRPTFKSTLLWQVNCNSVMHPTPRRTIATRDPEYLPPEVHENVEDKTFYASETQLPPSRPLSYKYDPGETSDNVTPGRLLKLDHLDCQFTDEPHEIHTREYRIDSGYDDSSHVSSDSSQEIVPQADDRSESPDIEDRMIRAEQKLVKRNSRRVETVHVENHKPPRVSSFEESPSEGQFDGDHASKMKYTNVQALTAMARKLSRPVLRKDEESTSFEEESYDISAWTNGSASTDSPRSDTTCEFDKFSEVTVETRKASKPIVRDLDLTPEKTRSRSITTKQVLSPTVPALSPNRNKFSFSRSLSTASSYSSSSEATTPSYVPDPCFRCSKQVYQLDKVGPVRRVLYHKMCFRCSECNTALTLKNFCSNANDKNDKHVYCKKHQPQQEKAHVDIEDRNINIALNNPKLGRVNTNIRGSDEDKAKGMNQRPIYVRGASIPKLDIVCGNQYGFSYTGGHPVEHDAGTLNPKPMRITSPREMNLEEVEPKRVWTRSAINAASLDLSAPISGRSAHHFYSYGTSAFNHL